MAPTTSRSKLPAPVARLASAVGHVASRVARRLPSEVDRDDLVQDGWVGVLESARTFDPARGVGFVTYSARRAQGAMLDGLRESDFCSRLARERGREVDATTERLTQALGRPPTDDEVAARTGARSVASASRRPATVSIDGPCAFRREDKFDGRADRRLGEFLRDPAAADPADGAERADLLQMITRGLTRDERLIVRLFYIEGCSMAEIGRAIGMCQSRVSQVARRVVAGLRARDDLRALAGVPADAPLPDQAAAKAIRAAIHPELKLYKPGREGTAGRARQGRRRTDAAGPGAAGSPPARRPAQDGRAAAASQQPFAPGGAAARAAPRPPAPSPPRVKEVGRPRAIAS